MDFVGGLSETFAAVASHLAGVACTVYGPAADEHGANLRWQRGQSVAEVTGQGWAERAGNEWTRAAACLSAYSPTDVSVI